MKLYRAIRCGHTCDVYVDEVKLELWPSQRLNNHSEAFEWGYGGSGPSQLALAILLDCCGNETVALRFYQDFKQDFIVNADYDGFTLMEVQITAWVARQYRNDIEGE